MEMRVLPVLVSDDDPLVLVQPEVAERAIGDVDQQRAGRSVRRRKADFKVVDRLSHDVVQACVACHLVRRIGDGECRDVSPFPPRDAITLGARCAELQVSREVGEACLAPGIRDHVGRGRRCRWRLRAASRTRCRSPSSASRSTVSANPMTRLIGTVSPVGTRRPRSSVRAQRPRGTFPARRWIASFSSSKQRISIRWVLRAGRGGTRDSCIERTSLLLGASPVIRPAGACSRLSSAGVLVDGPLHALVAGVSSCWRTGWPVIPGSPGWITPRSGFSAGGAVPAPSRLCSGPTRPARLRPGPAVFVATWPSGDGTL